MSSYSLLLLVIFAASPYCVSGEILLGVELRNGTAVNAGNHAAVPVQFNANSIDFEPVTGPIVLYSPDILTTDPALVKTWVVMVTLDTNSTVNHAFKTIYSLLDALPRFQPLAYMIYRPRRGDNYLGSITISSRNQIYDNVVRPAVEISNATGPLILEALSSATTLRVEATITDFGDNPYITFEHSPYNLTVGSILLIWEVANIALALYMLSGWRFVTRNVAVFCLWLDIVATIERLVFSTNLLGHYLTTSISSIFASCAIPPSFSSLIILTFYWHELVSKTSLNIASSLTRYRWLAILTIVLVTIMEVISSVFRTVGLDSIAVRVINGIFYLGVFFGLMIYIIYVAIRVLIFIRGLTKQRFVDRLLLKVTTRISFCIFGIIVILISVCLAFSTAVTSVIGADVIIYSTAHLAMCFMSTAQIMAFEHPKRKASDTVKTGFGTLTEVRKQSTGRSEGREDEGARSEQSHTSSV